MDGNKLLYLSKNKVPYFKESLGLIEGKVYKKLKSGDHTIIICKIINYSNFNSKKPLIYYKSKYQTI
jgi:flavin reductase (DIM6/NTAB) family NADH-FMN oxidoreductase RutF